MKRHAAVLGFLGCAVACGLLFASIARLAAAIPEGGSVRPLLPLFLLAMVPSLIAVWLLPRVRFEGATFALVVLVAVLVRAPFVPLEPGLSDDAYRYLWDGRVQVAGWNPYGIAPEDPALDAVEDGWPAAERVRDRVNHPEHPTVYPPFLELVFALVASLAGGLSGWKLVLLAAELLLALTIVRGLEMVGRDPRAVLLYLWHPLPVVEVAWNAHAEVLAVLPLVWCAVLLLEERRGLAGIALGGAIAAKLLPLGFVPLVVRRAGIGAGLLAVGTVVWLTVPFAGAELGAALDGVREYAGSWYFNDLLYRPLGHALGLDPEDRHAAGTFALRAGLAGVWGLVTLLVSGRSPLVAGLAITGAFVLLSPTVHPWYLLWVLPFAVLLEERAWWLLAGTVLIAYEVWIGGRAAGIWVEGAGTRALVYLAPLLLMLWAPLLARLRRARGTPSSGDAPASPGARSGSR